MEQKMKEMRLAGHLLRDIAEATGLAVQTVSAHLSKRSPIVDTERSVVRHIPVIGHAGSTTCYHQPVSMPRVSILENPERLAA